jgi:hypothetical protein
MNNNNNNILPNDSSRENEGLQALNDALNTEDIFFENEQSFEQEAAEGLKQIPQSKVPRIVSEINKELKKQLKDKKKLKREIPNQSMVYITIVTLLILIIVAYIVIKKITE